MKKFFILLAIACFIIACNSGVEEEPTASTTTPAPTAAPEKPAEDGKKIYKQYCVACHGLYGDMGTNGAFNLTTSELSLEERINVITNGRNTMTPWKGILSEEKIKAVAEYTQELKTD
ncbi:MAG: cytochrome c [Bacteroidota bacterium]